MLYCQGENGSSSGSFFLGVDYLSNPLLILCLIYVNFVALMNACNYNIYKMLQGPLDIELQVEARRHRYRLNDEMSEDS